MSIRLTQTVQKGGCAAKISAEVLREVLGKLDFSSKDPNVLIDGKDFDDAGIYQVTPEIALVQTLDFFTPIVDTPYLFGQIAATNALSDVYAMGGTPKTAMAILAFPLSTLDPEIMGEILAGAQSKIKESGASLVGGHSIDDDTIKFGLSVTGIVNPAKMWTNKNAKPGDRLILTKALGTGTLTAGLKNSDYSESDIQEALDSMATLNHVLDLLTEEELKQIHAGTDVTGFGLMGHAMQVGKASGVSLEISFSSLPVLDRAFDSLKADNLTKAHRTNHSYTKNFVKLDSTLNAVESQILFDPQTSGGLLLSVDSKFADQILAKLKTRFKKASIIGEVIPQNTQDGLQITIQK
jgi:selenide,water dikinase